MRSRRWIEWGKNLLILLLTLSAAYLLTMTPLVQDSGLLELLVPAEQPGNGGTGSTRTAAEQPARMAVNSERGRYGLQYDQDGVDKVFARLGPLLGEALASAGEAEAIDENQWQAYLKGAGIYFDFVGEVPLASLGSWLQGAGECLLDGSARRLLLAADRQDEVLLCWQDASGGFYASSTALTQRLHLEPAVEEFDGNGAFFAFEDEEMTRLLKPYTLVTEGGQTAKQYAVSNPLGTSEGVEALLEALDFGGQNHVTVNGGEVYLDGGDRLEVSGDGVVAYRSSKNGRYPVGQGTATQTQAVEAARGLAEAAVGAVCGDARLYLVSVQSVSNGFRVRFGCQLNGGAVYLGEQGWAAEFMIQDGYVAWFTLRLRCYTAQAEEALLLPIDRAAAMLPDLTEEKVELVIRYRDQGGGVTRPEWVMD